MKTASLQRENGSERGKVVLRLRSATKVEVEVEAQAEVEAEPACLTN